MNLSRPSVRPRIGLAPMIDVVFLLLVFFMLAARFGLDSTISVSLASGSSAYSGPPRLVEIHPDHVRLNGISLGEGTLADNLSALVSSSEDTVVLRMRGGADVQRLVDVMERLSVAGYPNLVLVE